MPVAEKKFTPTRWDLRLFAEWIRIWNVGFDGLFVSRYTWFLWCLDVLYIVVYQCYVNFILLILFIVFGFMGPEGPPVPFTGGEGKERTEENRDKTGTSFTLSSPLRRGLGGCSVRMDFATVFMSYGTSPCPPSQGGDKTLCQQVYCSLKRTSNNPLQEQMDACVSMDIAQSEA